MATTEEVLHELADAVGYDVEASIPYAVLARIAESHGVDVVKHYKHCIAGHLNEHCTCDAELDRRRGK